MAGLAVSSAELGAWVGGYLWPLARIGAMLSIAPILGAQAVPARVRVGLALLLTLVIAPLAPTPADLDPVSLAGLWVTVQQVIIGLAMGFALLLVFAAFIVGGQIFAMQMGLGFAALVDPQRGVQVPVISQFYVLVTTLVFLALDGHLVVVEVLAESFRLLPVGTAGLGGAGLWALVTWGQEMFSGAVRIALPAIATLMLVNLAFGVMMRAAPQLNIFAVGFPITMTVGFLIMLWMLPAVPARLQALAESAFALLRGPLLGG